MSFAELLELGRDDIRQSRCHDRPGTGARPGDPVIAGTAVSRMWFQAELAGALSGQIVRTPGEIGLWKGTSTNMPTHEMAQRQCDHQNRRLTARIDESLAKLSPSGDGEPLRRQGFFCFVRRGLVARRYPVSRQCRNPPPSGQTLVQCRPALGAATRCFPGQGALNGAGQDRFRGQLENSRETGSATPRIGANFDPLCCVRPSGARQRTEGREAGGTIARVRRANPGWSMKKIVRAAARNTVARSFGGRTDFS